MRDDILDTWARRNVKYGDADDTGRDVDHRPVPGAFGQDPTPYPMASTVHEVDGLTEPGAAQTRGQVHRSASEVLDDDARSFSRPEAPATAAEAPAGKLTPVQGLARSVGHTGRRLGGHLVRFAGRIPFLPRLVGGLNRWVHRTGDRLDDLEDNMQTAR